MFLERQDAGVVLDIDQYILGFQLKCSKFLTNLLFCLLYLLGLRFFFLCLVARFSCSALRLGFIACFLRFCSFAVAAAVFFTVSFVNVVASVASRAAPATVVSTSVAVSRAAPATGVLTSIVASGAALGTSSFVAVRFLGFLSLVFVALLLLLRTYIFLTYPPTYPLSADSALYLWVVLVSLVESVRLLWSLVVSAYSLMVVIVSLVPLSVSVKLPKLVIVSSTGLADSA